MKTIGLKLNSHFDKYLHHNILSERQILVSKFCQNLEYVTTKFSSIRFFPSVNSESINLKKMTYINKKQNQGTILKHIKANQRDFTITTCVIKN